VSIARHNNVDSATSRHGGIDGGLRSICAGNVQLNRQKLVAIRAETLIDARTLATRDLSAKAAAGASILRRFRRLTNGLIAGKAARPGA